MLREPFPNINKTNSTVINLLKAHMCLNSIEISMDKNKIKSRFKLQEIVFEHGYPNVNKLKITLTQQIQHRNLGNKMAIRIKTFLVAIFFLVICYLVLYFPMLFTLRTHSEKETQNFVQLNTLEKIIPVIASLLFVSMSIGYRLYMEKLSEKRNPKN